MKSCLDHIFDIEGPMKIKSCQLMHLGVKVCANLKVGHVDLLFKFYGHCKLFLNHIFHCVADLGVKVCCQLN